MALVGPCWEKLCPKSWVWLEVVRSFFLKKKKEKRAFSEIIYTNCGYKHENNAFCKKQTYLKSTGKCIKAGKKKFLAAYIFV